MQDGTKTFEVMLIKARSMSQRNDATALISLTKSLGLVIKYNAVLTWSRCFWALNWCPCMLRGNDC